MSYRTQSSGQIDLDESPSLRVARKRGETALSVSKQLNILDRKLRITSTDSEVLIPLSRLPSQNELDILKAKLRDFQIARYSFKRRDERPRSLIEAINDRVPPHVLAALPRSYDVVGDIAILEVPETLLEYRHIVGESMMRANPHAKTVMAKAGPVSDKFRVRKFIVIAGRPSTVTEHSEHGRVFRLDLSRVYFSPRLSHERQRVASSVKEGEVIVDMFAGVGPFSIVAAGVKNVRKAYGIDLNPDAAAFMLQNVILNNLRGKVTVVLSDATATSKIFSTLADRVIMNLPADSARFIPEACRFLRAEGGTIHFYKFVSEETPRESILESIQKEIERSGRKVVSIDIARDVKAVAPREFQLAIDIRVA